MATPYITPAMLLARPAGIAWNVIPTLTANTEEQQAQLAQECWTATSRVDAYAKQPLRAVVNNEPGRGPGHPRVSVDRSTGTGLLVTRRWPVTDVAAIQVSPFSAFPAKYSLVPAGQYRIRHPVEAPMGGVPVTDPSGGNVIDLAQGYVDWSQGRGGWQILTSYVSGWPHTSLTADAEAEATTLHVDDVTGWAPDNTTGWDQVTGFAYDAIETEAVTAIAAAATSPAQLPGVAGTVQTGPGTLTLATGLANGHTAGTVISALPAIAIYAAALAATVQALEGIDAIATQSLSGQMAGGTGVLAEEFELQMDRFARVI